MSFIAIDHSGAGLSGAASLTAEITELCCFVYAAEYRLLTLIREFDEKQYWAEPGFCSCAHWLNFKCGIGMNAAQEKVRVAHALAALPKISATFERGALSYSKIRAMTRIADTDNEDYLLMIAEHGTAHHVERLVSQCRKAKRLQEAQLADEQYPQRELTHYYDHDGFLVIRARMPAEQGALVVKALEMAMDSAAGESSAAGVTAETSRRVACDSTVVRITEDRHGEPLSIGRRSRTIPPSMRRALVARDKGCRFPGCTHTRFVDGHHIEHWANGGETSLDNLVLLCRHHHHLVHEGGFACEKDDFGEIVFRDRSNGRLDTHAALPGVGDGDEFERWFDREFFEAGIEKNACVAKWQAGNRIDWQMAVSAMFPR